MDYNYVGRLMVVNTLRKHITGDDATGLHAPIGREALEILSREWNMFNDASYLCVVCGAREEIWGCRVCDAAGMPCSPAVSCVCNTPTPYKDDD